MRIIEYNESMRDEWNSFVIDSNNGTVFAMQDFFDYHPPERFSHRHLMFYQRNTLVSVFPATDMMRDDKRILVSHGGASFGGFVLRHRAGVSEALFLVNTLLNFAVSEGFDGVELTRPPWIYYRFPEDHIDFALFNSGAKHKKRELTAVLPIMTTLKENLAIFRTTARTAMRKAAKMKVVIRQTEDFVSFHHILTRNLSMRHGVAPTHSIEELYHLKELLPEKIKLFAAYAEQQMIAGCLIFVCNECVILAFYITQDYEHQNLRPLNLLFAEIIRWAIKSRFKWLDFGTYTLNNVPNLGLARFKESLGAKGIFRDTFHIRF